MPNAKYTISFSTYDFESVLAIRERKKTEHIGNKGHFFELPTPQKESSKTSYACRGLLFLQTSIFRNLKKKNSFSFDFSRRKDYNFRVYCFEISII